MHEYDLSLHAQYSTDLPVDAQIRASGHEHACPADHAARADSAALDGAYLFSFSPENSLEPWPVSIRSSPQLPAAQALTGGGMASMSSLLNAEASSAPPIPGQICGAPALQPAAPSTGNTASILPPIQMPQGPIDVNSEAEHQLVALKSAVWIKSQQIGPERLGHLFDSIMSSLSSLNTAAQIRVLEALNSQLDTMLSARDASDPQCATSSRDAPHPSAVREDNGHRQVTEGGSLVCRYPMPSRNAMENRYQAEDLVVPAELLVPLPPEEPLLNPPKPQRITKRRPSGRRAQAHQFNDDPATMFTWMVRLHRHIKTRISALDTIDLYYRAYPNNGGGRGWLGAKPESRRCRWTLDDVWGFADETQNQGRNWPKKHVHGLAERRKRTEGPSSNSEQSDDDEQRSSDQAASAGTVANGKERGEQERQVSAQSTHAQGQSLKVGWKTRQS
jgi:hypothetical protein